MACSQKVSVPVREIEWADRLVYISTVQQASRPLMDGPKMRLAMVRQKNIYIQTLAQQLTFHQQRAKSLQRMEDFEVHPQRLLKQDY